MRFLTEPTVPQAALRAAIAALIFLAASCSPTPAAAPEVDNLYAKVLVTISKAEGYRKHPYPDRGDWTIGYGRNLTARGISPQEAWVLMRNDVNDVVDELNTRLAWWRNLNDPRRAALVEMGYNLGVDGLLEFERMLAALRHEQWGLAAREALDSVWARQVGPRAHRLARQLGSGEWQ